MQAMQNVPIDLFIYSVQNNLENQLKTYLELKFLFVSGNFTLSSANRKRIIQKCGFKSHNTLDNHLDVLMDLNWIYIIPEKKQIVLRSSIALVPIKTKINVKIESANLGYFKGFIGLVLFSYLTNYFWSKKITKIKEGLRYIEVEENKIYSVKKEKKVVIDNGKSRIVPLGFLRHEPAPCALKGAASYYKINRSKINRLKQEAIKAGFLESKNRKTPLNVAKDISAKQFNQHAKNGFALGKRGHLMHQEPDLVKPYLILRFVHMRRQKLKRLWNKIR